MRLDRFTVRNLELVESFSEDGKSLLNIIDRTVTPVGARMLHRWILFPLKDPKEINNRLDVVEYFFKHPDQREEIKTYLEQIGDIERLTSKVSFARISPREMIQLRNALNAIEPIRKICIESDLPVLRALGEQLNPCNAVSKPVSYTHLTLPTILLV